MTTPRQYTDSGDPNLIPPDQNTRQADGFETQGRRDEFGAPTQRDEFGAPGQRDDLGAPAQRDEFGAPAQHQQVDPAAQQFAAPPAEADPAFRSPDGTNSAAANQTATPTTPAHGSSSGDALFAEQDLSELRTRWNDVQASFVDDPRDCVQQADGLVSSAVEQLTASFAHTRSRLEEQWSRGEEASTEDLRVALKQYRDFFDRLLAV